MPIDKAELIKTIGTNVVDLVERLIDAGRKREEIVAELIAALERKDIVSDELFDRFESYIQDTKNFEENG